MDFFPFAQIDISGQAIKELVLAFGITFTYLLELSLLLTAMFAPIAVGASLLLLHTRRFQ